METLKPFLGSYMESSLFLNNGKYGWYLNHNNKLYSVPKCFQKPTFKLDDAIKIIKYKQQTQKQKQEEDIIKKLDREPTGEADGASEDLDDIIKKIKSKKSSRLLYI
jgi:topoisomerase IA-like protein